MNDLSPWSVIIRWCWRLLPLALMLATWAVWNGRNTGESLLPVTTTSVVEDWALAWHLTGKPL